VTGTVWYRSFIKIIIIIIIIIIDNRLVNEAREG